MIRGSGGRVGLECSATDTEVMGSIPSVDRNFFAKKNISVFTPIFLLLLLSKTLTLDIGFFYLVHLVNSFFFFSPLPLCASCTKYTNVLSLSLFSVHYQPDAGGTKHQ